MVFCEGLLSAGEGFIPQSLLQCHGQRAVPELWRQPIFIFSICHSRSWTPVPLRRSLILIGQSGWWPPRPHRVLDIRVNKTCEGSCRGWSEGGKGWKQKGEYTCKDEQVSRGESRRTVSVVKQLSRVPSPYFTVHPDGTIEKNQLSDVKASVTSSATASPTENKHWASPSWGYAACQGNTSLLSSLTDFTLFVSDHTTTSLYDFNPWFPGG